MSDINEKHLDYIQDTITRMAKNSFQAKTWAITIISALLAVAISNNDNTVKHLVIFVSVAVTVLFGLLDTYYLYLEQGYRRLYKIAACLTEEGVIQRYEMEMPKSCKGFRKYVRAIFRPTTGLFYSVIIVLLIALLFFI